MTLKQSASVKAVLERPLKIAMAVVTATTSEA
jgi:hypothetical protein